MVSRVDRAACRENLPRFIPPDYVMPTDREHAIVLFGLWGPYAAILDLRPLEPT